MEDLLRQEELVDKHVRDEEPEKAVSLLFDLIVQYVGKRDFSKAEALRERIFQIDSMALTEIVRSAELIEEAKSESIDRSHLELWAELHKKLTPEESNAFYYSLEEKIYEADQPVFSQGDRNRFLYFIDRGRLKMIYSKGGQEILLKTLNSPGIAGEDTFFNHTLCTTSLITVSRVRASLLSDDVLQRWKTEFPVLESKLYDYSHTSEKVEDLLKKKALDRRVHKRVPITGKGTIQLLKPSGTPLGGAFKGSLVDISAGGLCFFVKISKKETARLLLGQKLSIKFAHYSELGQHPVDQVGLVVAVRSHPFEDYSVHVRFDKHLGLHILEAVENFQGAAEPK